VESFSCGEGRLSISKMPEKRDEVMAMMKYFDLSLTAYGRMQVISDLLTGLVHFAAQVTSGNPVQTANTTLK